MDIEEKREKVAHLHKYFVKSFWLSFLFLILATWLCIAMHNVQVAFINKYFPMPVEEYNEIVVFLLGFWKILIFQFTLIPALVLWCMKKRCCKGECKKEG